MAKETTEEHAESTWESFKVFAKWGTIGGVILFMILGFIIYYA